MPDNELALIPTSSPIALRSAEVLEAILSIKSTLMRRALELGRLLKEARDNDYANVWGFARFGDWVEESSGLDMSARSAYDLIKLIEQSQRLGIPDEELELVKISKLKAIFTLKDGEMSDDEIRSLVRSAEVKTLKDVVAEVGIAKQQEWVNRNYKFDKIAYENTVRPAIERVKREYENTIDEFGNETEISDSKAIEMMSADLLAGPENQAEYEEYEAEFEDTFLEAA